MTPVAPTGGAGSREVVAGVVPQRNDADLVLAEPDAAARRILHSLLDIDPAVLRDDTPLFSLGWSDGLWLCLAEMLDFTITDRDAQQITTFGDLARWLGAHHEH